MSASKRLLVIPSTNRQALAVKPVKDVIGEQEGDSNIVDRVKMMRMPWTSLTDALNPTLLTQ